ncbi:MAG TPA: hypothetical protein ENK49_00780 [Gammaproteobacteria bacterium]|nr:hypothetical protein [Gammaproteobacteria bacterium]
MEPIVMAARTNTEVWVVNHLSDSVSIVDVSGVPRVTHTLLVGDEPRDIVFAGTGGTRRAFVTTAHRGQSSPWGPDTLPDNLGEFATPGIGRADLWAFDAGNPTAPATMLSFFTDTLRALVVSPDGRHVYVAGFHTGNRTTIIPEGAVCNGGATAAPCNPGGADPRNLEACPRRMPTSSA